MAEERKVRLAKMRLTKLAKIYWLNDENLREVRRQEPIYTWEDMKTQLRSKYLPPSYDQTLLDEWQSLTQEGKPVGEYIEKFDHYLLKCGVREDPAVTLSRFKNGLQHYIKRELFMREGNTLEHAYQIARDAEKFSRFPRPAPSRPIDSKILGSKPNSTPPV